MGWGPLEARGEGAGVREGRYGTAGGVHLDDISPGAGPQESSGRLLCSAPERGNVRKELCVLVILSE